MSRASTIPNTPYDEVVKIRKTMKEQLETLELPANVFRFTGIKLDGNTQFAKRLREAIEQVVEESNLVEILTNGEVSNAEEIVAEWVESVASNPIPVSLQSAVAKRVVAETYPDAEAILYPPEEGPVAKIESAALDL